MFTYERVRHLPHSYPFRWSARASAAVLFAIWVVLLTLDLSRLRLGDLGVSTYGQGACLLFAFAGYLVGLRHELAGGIAGILGTLAFVTVVSTTTSLVPGGAAFLFALPGVLYLLAWYYDERRQLQL